MMDTGNGHPAAKFKIGVWGILPILAAAFCALSANYAIAAPAGSYAGAIQIDPQVARLLEDADKALNAKNLNLALIQLKNAVRLAPENGEVRARLGAAILLSGELVAAERELRQAQRDYAPYDMVVPPLLRVMLQRNEIKELLTEFPDPPQGTQDDTTADVLAARAIALQFSGMPKQARAAMDRSLSLRRDADGLVNSARLAQQQGDLALARNLSDDALKLSPMNEQALLLNVLLARQSGDSQKALASADEFVQRVPRSVAAKALRIEALLELKQDARAKQDVDALLKETPNSPFGRYYRGVLMARADDYKGAWREIQSLQQAFVQSQPDIAMTVAQIATTSGYTESGGSILQALISRHPEIPQARMQLAVLRLNQKNPDAALKALDPIKTSNDPLAQAILAQTYLQLQRFSDAIAALDKATAAGTGGGNDLLTRQITQLELQGGETAKATQGLQDIAGRDPGNAAINAQLIVALVRAGKADEALGVTDRMAKSSPNSPLPPFYRGLILNARGNLAAASIAFGQAVAADPRFLPALYYRANASMARGNVEEGAKDLQQILQQDPASVLAYIKLAQIALNNDQEPQLVALLGKAIKAAPNDPNPRLALANYQLARAKYQEAHATVIGLLQVSPNNLEGLALQGQIQFAQGMQREAVQTFRALASANAQSPAAQVLLARILSVTKDSAGAEVAARKAIELAPASVEVRSILIQLQIADGKPDDALTSAREYGSTYPGPAADLLLADTLLGLKRTKEATDVLTKSFGLNPDRSSAMRLSQIAMSQGDSKKASAVLSGWLRKSPNDFDVRRQYALLLMQTGDQTNARGEFEELLKQRPEDPMVLNNLGVILQKDDSSRALSLVSLAAKIAPRSPDINDTLGWIKFQRQDHQGALLSLQRAHDLKTDDGEIGYHYALALDAVGKRAEAKSLLQSALAKNEKFEDEMNARQLLGRW